MFERRRSAAIISLTLRGCAERARTVAEEAVKIAEEVRLPDLAASARVTLGWALSHAGAYREALEILQSCLKSARNPWQLARACLNLAGAQHGMGQYEAAIQTAGTGLEAARTAGVERSLGVVLYVRLASSLAAVGRWDEADTTAIKGLELDGSATHAAALHALRAEVALARGDLDGVREEVSRAPRAPMLAHQQAELALLDNRIPDARRAIVEALRIARESGDPSQIWAILTSGARVESQARIGSRVDGDGGGIVDELRVTADGLRNDSPVLSAYAAQFAAELGDGGWPDVVAAWEAIGQPYRTAYARLRAAQAALASGDRDPARDWLETAAQQAGRLGARPLLDEIRLLARSAHLPIDPVPAGEKSDARGLGLTDRETEVLRHISAGRSNKQIAEALFVSTKTVSVHVSNILAKFGVGSRGEAAATAHRLRLFDSDGPG